MKKGTYVFAVICMVLSASAHAQQTPTTAPQKGVTQKIVDYFKNASRGSGNNRFDAQGNRIVQPANKSNGYSYKRDSNGQIRTKSSFDVLSE